MRRLSKTFKNAVLPRPRAAERKNKRVGTTRQAQAFAEAKSRSMNAIRMRLIPAKDPCMAGYWAPSPVTYFVIAPISEIKRKGKKRHQMGLIKDIAI